MSEAIHASAPGAAPEPTTLHEFFASAAARWPDRTAIDVPPGPHRPIRQQWSYAELAAAAATVRGALAAVVTGECVVAILLPRGTPWLYAAQLGVLQGGAAYVCLDAGLPDELLHHVLRDSAAVLVLSDAAGERRLRAAGVPLPPVATVPAPLPARPAPPPSWLGPRSLAYVIYTSGSTGRPKGVLLEHRGAANLVASDLETFALQPGDRIAQGSSAAYDSAVEETWLALAAGATLVVMDEDAARLGPDLVAWLRRERITVFCPPPTQLRAMACADPASELPDLRLLYVGGEALPQDLADHWAGCCWLENGYGPTECSVTVVRGRVRVGQPVTIGRPIRGHRAFVLDERLEPVAAGAEGELCIAGPGLARGYLNQPELTAERFPTHREFGRLYRTGDLVRAAAGGELVCLGRIDAQVKLRGHRIELEAIEAMLATCSGVRQAGCCLRGAGAEAQLVGFVVPCNGDAPPDVAALRRELGTRVPDHMVPSRFGFVATLPTTVGGKLDRRALPELPAEAAPPARPAAPRDPLQARLLRALEGLLPGAPSVSVDDDFFAVGGDSLRAAQWISRLRADPDTACLTVRDVYEHRTVAGLARRARAAEPPIEAREPAAPREPQRVAVVLVGQLVWLLSSLWLTAGALYALCIWLLPELLSALGPSLAVLALPLLVWVGVAAYATFAVAFAVATKRLLLGVCRPGAVPVWSSAFLRHWIVQQAVRLVPWNLLQGTELQCAVLRRLGARIGQRVHIHRGVDLQRGGWDLLTLGDDATLCQDASLLLATLANGHLVVRPVTVGARSTVDVRGCVDGGAALGDDAFLTASSWLAPGTRVADGEAWDGIPAAKVGKAPAPAAPVGEVRALSVWAHAAATCLLRIALSLVLMLPATAVVAAGLALSEVDAHDLLQWLSAPWSPALGLALALPALGLPFTLLWQALLARWLAPAAGHFPLRCLAQVRVHLATGLVHDAGEWISGTLFWPWWLRLAGMRVGRRCEISTILDVVPAHVQIGDDTFFADGIYLAGPRMHRGVVSLLPTTVGRNTFLGNHVVVPIGQQLPDDVLLGVCTVADDRRMHRGTDWFGQPPFVLPRREVVVADRRLTHEPGPLRRANRLFWEALRGLLPCVPILLGLLWYEALAATGRAEWQRGAFVVAPLATLAIAAASCACVLALKWLLLGRVRRGQHALWSCWCSRWDFLFVAWNRLACPVLAALEGTLLLPWFLRATGAHIGRRTVLGPGFAQLVDPDMIHIEDEATVDAQFQAHSFEDRVLKIDHLHIRRGATVGHGTVLLYGADIGERATTAPQSVVMKQERLLPRRRYGGFPVRTMGADVTG